MIACCAGGASAVARPAARRSTRRARRRSAWRPRSTRSRAAPRSSSPGSAAPCTANGPRGRPPGDSAMSIRVFGDHDAATVAQLENCVAAEPGADGVLCADGHIGYSMPIGGVVASREHISPSGVGFDIACGNKAARTSLTYDDVAADLPRIMDEVFSRISFGVGRNDGRAGDHPVIDEIRASGFEPQRELADLAARQLGTVGAGNHYV